MTLVIMTTVGGGGGGDAHISEQFLLSFANSKLSCHSCQVGAEMADTMEVLLCHKDDMNDRDDNKDTPW